MADEVQARIAELKRQRGYFAAFGQSQKVKAVDVEIAQLRAKQSEPVKPSRKPPAEVETAEADQSETETATVRSATRKRRSTSKKSDD